MKYQTIIQDSELITDKKWERLFKVFESPRIISDNKYSMTHEKCTVFTIGNFDAHQVFMNKVYEILRPKQMHLVRTLVRV
jgi:hypothetical protein